MSSTTGDIWDQTFSSQEATRLRKMSDLLIEIIGIRADVFDAYTDDAMALMLGISFDKYNDLSKGKLSKFTMMELMEYRTILNLA